MRNPFKKKPKLLNLNGWKVRPAKGSCPKCGAKEKEWCAKWCDVLDPANMSRE